MSTSTLTKWTIDAAHSEIRFKVRHMMLSNVSGNFKEFSATAETLGDDFSTAKVVFTAQAASIDTGIAQRDEHLKGPDFFDAAAHPEIKFESQGPIEKHQNDYVMNGVLEIRGVSKPVKMSVEFNGTGKDPWGNMKAGYTLHGKINRKDWGLNWNAPLEAGGWLVSEDIFINCEVQFTRVAE
jgi:polyisoprenoid-binding protein YceI